MKFYLEVYETMTERLIISKTIDFLDFESAEIWAKEHYNTDCYACVTEYSDNSSEVVNTFT